jgi:hypothetical protein
VYWEDIMAKIVKFGENEWAVIDNNAIFVNSDGTIPCSSDGRTHRVFNCGGKQTENSGWVGTVYLDGGDEVMFIPSENGVEHTAGHLREIADLMDGLQAGK